MKVSCRYNPKHKVKKDELLSHEDICPDKEKRKDLKACPYRCGVIVKVEQYQKHLQKCKNKPAEVIEEKKPDYFDITNTNNDFQWNTELTPESTGKDWSKEEKKIEERKEIIIPEFDSEDNVFKLAYI